MPQKEREREREKRSGIWYIVERESIFHFAGLEGVCGGFYFLIFICFREMSGGGCSIVWFRRDLRVEDNPALAAGVRAGAVVAVFIWAPEEEGHYYPGRVSRWWLKQSLAHLDSSLRSLGTSLITKRSSGSVSSLLEVVKSTGANRLFFNHLYGQFLLFYFIIIIIF